MLKRLYKSLSDRPGASVELGATVNGHPVDAIVRTDRAMSAIVLDRGLGDTADAAQHLRVMLRRRELLDAVRIPAWQLYDTETSGV